MLFYSNTTCCWPPHPFSTLLYVISACLLPLLVYSKFSSLLFILLRLSSLFVLKKIIPQFLCVGYSLVKDALLAPEPFDLQFEQADVFHPLVVVEVTLAQD